MKPYKKISKEKKNVSTALICSQNQVEVACDVHKMVFLCKQCVD